MSRWNAKWGAAIFLVGAFSLGRPAMAIEEPNFELLSKEGGFELRRYAPMVVAEATVEGELGQASNRGFRLIAGYIFGGNRSLKPEAKGGSESIAMTAPVGAEPLGPPEKIAMTAPVGAQPLAEQAAASPTAEAAPGMEEARRWRIHFVMPGSYSLAKLPKPDNSQVSLREVPGRTCAVIRFSGTTPPEKADRRTRELLEWMKGKGLKPRGTPELARYNPPWTLPFWRRNEILIEVEP